MKVLLAGANSYIGARLIPFLQEKGHQVICIARDKKYFSNQSKYDGVTVINGDLLRTQSIEQFPQDIDAAFYLANRLTQTSGFAGLEALSAQNFMDALDKTDCTQLITVGDITNTSRTHIENILAGGKAALTALETSMIIGEGSISMELFNALTQNTPIVIAKSWANTAIQPVFIEDVLNCLHDCLLNGNTFNRKFDIGGPQIFTFKQMMLVYIATYIDLKPDIVILPFLNSKFASYLVNFLSPTSYPEAQSLLQNLSNDSVCRDNCIIDVLPHEYTAFKQALKLIHDKTDETVLI
ncbi:MAG: NAD(P)H-binding protein [Sphingobacteriales bacterium]